ncbi:MAG: immunoglobulin domain-containing protein [Verrucomicrobiota bacterium JB024]|nr:immunoglobulin domain-containing protein [Verrucomicrobiota bacterium JB024]
MMRGRFSLTSKLILLVAFLFQLALPNGVRADGAPAELVSGYDAPGFNGVVRAIYLLGDGRVLVGGEFTMATWTANGGGSSDSVRYLALIKEDGSIDTDFDPDVNSTVHSICSDRTGRIYIGGDFTAVGGLTRYRVARFKADLTVDSGFDTSGGPSDSSVYAVAVDSDGQIWAGGSFTNTYVGAGCYLIRLNEDGSQDTGFTVYPESSVSLVVPTEDGKIYVGGYFNSYGSLDGNFMVRLFNDGTNDDDFIAQTGAWVLAIAPLADGKILISGAGTTISRLTKDGTLDRSFEVHGLDEYFNTLISDIAVQADGKIIAICRPSTLTSPPDVPYIVRLNSDGSVDTGFEVGEGFNVGAYALALEPLGNVWVAGDFTSYQGTTVSRLIRLNGDAKNVVITGQPNSMSLETGEKGTFTVSAVGNSSLAYQWKKDGVELPGETNASLDISSATESDEGEYTVVVTDTQSGDSVTSSIADLIFLTEPEILSVSDDLTLVVGQGGAFSVEVRGASSLTYQWKRNGTNLSDGERVSGSTTPTLAISPSGFGDAGTYTLVVQNDYGTLATTSLSLSVIPNPAALDGTWRQVTNTAAESDFDAGLDGPVTGILPLPDGGALVAGDFSAMDGEIVNGLMRIDGSGNLISDFVNPGIPAGTIRTMVLTGDGHVLVGGIFSRVNDIIERRYLVKISLNGVIDTRYMPAPDKPVRKVLMLGDGNHIVVGSFWVIDGIHRRHIAKLNADGVLDTSFPLTSTDVMIDVVQDSEGWLYFGGQGHPVDNGSTRYSLSHLWRASVSGVLDSPEPYYDANDMVEHFTAAPAGKLYVSGYFMRICGVPQQFLAHLNADGSRDRFFGQLYSNITSSQYRPTAIYATPDGGVIVSMPYTWQALGEIMCLVKLNEDGDRDSWFDVGGGLDSPANVIEAGAGGRIWVGGDFTTYNGITVNHLMRLNGYPENTDIATPFETWAGAYGLTGSHVLATADSDADGMPLLVEFVVGTDPTRFDKRPSSGQPTKSRGRELNAFDPNLSLDDSKNYISFTTSVRRELGDLLVEPQAATAPDFSESALMPEINQVGGPIVDGDFDVMTYVVTPALEDIQGSTPSVFFRLKITD